MRVPLSWLREFVEVDLTPDRLADRLTLLGMEVKAVERWGADWHDVVVGELLAVEPHPRADRLSVTRVTIGTGEPLEIVCGATNIATGQRVPVALPGAVLPDGRPIGRAEKMGVVSAGMLCSGDELHLTGDADGILILPADSPLGLPLVELLGDWVLDVDVKPNRGDALSIVGLAREVAAAAGGTVNLPPTDAEEAGGDVRAGLTVEVRDPDLCSRFVGRVVNGIRVGPAPDRVQARLLAAGMRPVSNVVDASNYVMLELGKPIHTFDAAAVHGGGIVVRRAVAGETLETLDHVRRTLDPDTLLIADSVGPLGIAGIMGGSASEVSGATSDVIIESAIFDPVSIRRAGHRYGLRSEASLRFEKGQEFRLARIGADRTARLILDWAGGTLRRGHVDTNPQEPHPLRIAFRPARVNRLLGTSLSVDEQRTLLARVCVETEPAQAGARIHVSAGGSSSGAPPLTVPAESQALVAIIPTWRRDLVIEADVSEEIARVHGYDRIPSILPDTAMPAYRPYPLGLRDAVRETLVGAGLSETITFALVPERQVETFGPHPDVASVEGEGPAGGAPIHVRNPLSAQHTTLRQSLIGSLLEVVSANRRHGRDDVAVFEVGKGYARLDDRTNEWWRLGIALTGDAVPPHWADRSRPFELDDAKGLVELVCTRLGLDRPSFEPVTDDPNFHPGRAARVAAARAVGEALGLAGRVGELDPRLLEDWDVGGGRVIVAELAIAGLAGGDVPTPRAIALARHPAVERDVAVVVADGVPVATVGAVIRRRGGSLLRGVRLFDVYRGAPLGADEKSLAFRLVLQSADRTLTDEEVETVMADVRAGFEAELGAHVRA